MTGRLLTTREVADRLGLNPETVLRWARRGKLPAHYLSSRAIRFDELELDAWLVARANGADTFTRPNGRAALHTPPARPEPD